MPTYYNYTENGVVIPIDDIFLTSDAFRQGNLWAWGRNDTFGQLGDNTAITKSIPVTTFAGGTNWKQVSSFNNHTAAIKTDGTLWTWGHGLSGRLGNNTTTNRSTPVTTFAGGSDWKQVSCGYSHTAAIKTDGTLWTWGTNYSRLGDDTVIDRSTPVTTFAGGTNWKQVACGSNHIAAIKTDGTLWIWGSNYKGELGNNATTQRCTPVTTFAGGSDWKQVACGFRYTSAIKTDGTLWTWGFNGYGQLGDNTTTDRCTPVTTFAGGTNWKKIGGGYGNMTAIKTDGTLWTWGGGFGAYGSQGALGDNTIINRSTPVTTFAGGTNWKQVSGGSYYTAAIKTDGTLWTWGRNPNGQLGDNTTTQRNTPVTTFAGGTDWKQVAAGDYGIAAITYIDTYQ